MGSTVITDGQGHNGHINNTHHNMRVLGKTVYRGPHLFSDTPMVRIILDLGRLEAYPTHKIPGFVDALVKAMPTLEEHTCSYDAPGGFVRRMKEGTWLGHVVEHVALEFQCLIGCQVTRGKTRSVKEELGVYNVMFQYETENVGLWAGRFALDLVSSLLPDSLSGVENLPKLIGDGEPAFTTVEAALKTLRDVAADERLGPTTRAITQAAEKRNIPVMRLDDQSLVQLGWGKNQRRIRASITDATSQIAVDAAGDKALTKSLLAAAGVPVPQGGVARSEKEALEIAREIGYPVVMKPLDGNHGRGVTTNIGNDAEARSAFALAAEHGRDIVVEQFYSGKDFRVLVINGQVVAVAERVPAHVVGDGQGSIATLIDKVNADPRRGNGHEQVLTKITVDPHVEATIKRQGHSLGSVPKAGQIVYLRDTANLSTGGTAIDRTDEIHSRNIAHMERAAKAIGLDICGIDVVTSDISRPLERCGGGVVEINAAPGFRMHLEPSEGRARPVGEAVIDMLYPEDKPARIPICAITGTNGKSTTSRMVVNILRQAGHSVGFTSTSGVYIDDQVLWEGDASGPKSARMLFKDNGIDYAVLETARGGIVREGLAFDSCDVGAVLNVTADHLGISGVHTLEQLAKVKSVVVEAVKRKGVAVLNADDPMTRGMAEDAGGRICYFSMAGSALLSDLVKKHIADGGMAVVREDWTGEDEIVIHVDGRRMPVIGVRHIPATLNGIAGFNIQNALAAAAIAFGLGMDVKAIRAGLASFTSTYEQNPGRMNIFDGHGFRTIVDYAHNPAALASLLSLTSRMDVEGIRIGTVSTPGDRRDEDIIEMGRIAASGLDYIVFREDPDRRGREPGGTVRLLKQGALAAGFPEKDIVCVAGEEEARQLCLKKAKRGDLVLLMPTDVEGAWKELLTFKPARSYNAAGEQMIQPIARA